MRYTLQLAAAAAVFPIITLGTPASAALQLYIDVSGTVFTCADNAGCDSDPATGTIAIPAVTINGVTISEKTILSLGTPADPNPIDLLDISALAVTNTTGVVKTVTAVVSDTDFTSPVEQFSSAGSGLWVATNGSTIIQTWYLDPANTQGADSTGNTPGMLLATEINTAAAITQSFSQNTKMPLDLTSPFSMTEEANYTLMPGGSLLNRGQAEVMSGIPEPSTWAMMVIGFMGLAYAAVRRGRKERSAVAL
jgi:PEP-CTERM motif